MHSVDVTDVTSKSYRFNPFQSPRFLAYFINSWTKFQNIIGHDEWRINRHRVTNDKNNSSLSDKWQNFSRHSSTHDEWREKFVIFWRMMKRIRHLLTNDETPSSSFDEWRNTFVIFWWPFFVICLRLTKDEWREKFVIFDEWQNAFVIFWRMTKHLVKFGQNNSSFVI